MEQAKIAIPERCEPYMYNTPDDLNKINIGDVIQLRFSRRRFRVKKEYRGKSIKFVVNNYREHNWRRPTRRLALIPLDKQDAYTEKDVLFLDDEDRFECLMIDLFPCNRKPYAGWKNKTVRVATMKG
jgi:hypothetical protein